MIVYYYFLWNFFSVLGYAPQVFICSFCKNNLSPGAIYFSAKESGVICQSCYLTKKDGIKVEADALKVLRLIFKKEWDTICKLKMGAECKKSLHEVSDYYHNHLLGFALDRHE